MSKLEEQTIELYRPANGTEGEVFFVEWCRHCARDKAMREGESVDECDDDEICPIIAETFVHYVDDPEYPREWRIVEGRAICTAFVPVGNSLPHERCDKTLELPL